MHHADISASALDKSKHSFTCLTSVENIQTVLTSLLSQCYISESNSWKLSKEAKQQREKLVFQLILFSYVMFKSKPFSLPALSPMNTFNVKLLNRFPPKTQIGLTAESTSVWPSVVKGQWLIPAKCMALLAAARAASHIVTGGEGECTRSTGIEVYYWPSPAHQIDTLEQI